MASKSFTLFLSHLYILRVIITFMELLEYKETDNTVPEYKLIVGLYSLIFATLRLQPDPNVH